MPTTFVLMATTADQAVVAQSASAPATFEVASIRRVTDPSPFPILRIAAGGRLQGRSDLRGIIYLAYGLEIYERIVPAAGVESRSLEDVFEVATVPPQMVLSPTPEDVMAMTRQMLAERFRLKIRVDTELVNATVLRTITPGILGPGLRPAPGGCITSRTGARPDRSLNCTVTRFGNSIRGTATLDEFARSLSLSARRPILNGTNLEGLFTIDLTVAASSLRPNDSSSLIPNDANQTDAPALVDALREQMGLSARTERQPIRRVVVEQVGSLIEN